MISSPVTVVVATRDRPEQLRRCLDALLALDHRDCRIVVVDDGSRTPVGDDLGERVLVLRREGIGPAGARNHGLEAATTDFVAFTDDDCTPAPDWLARLQRAHAADPEALIGGRVVNALPRNPFSSASQSIVDALYGWYLECSDRLQFFTTNNMAFSRRILREVGGLDASFPFAAEDRDLGLRWRRSGRPLVHVADAVVHHAHDLSPAGFWRQHARYGRGARRLHLKRAREGEQRLPVEPWRFYWRLLAYPCLRADRPAWPAALAQAALVGLSQVAMVHGYLAERVDERRRVATPAAGPARRLPAPADIRAGAREAE